MCCRRFHSTPNILVEEEQVRGKVVLVDCALIIAAKEWIKKQKTKRTKISQWGKGSTVQTTKVKSEGAVILNEVGQRCNLRRDSIVLKVGLPIVKSFKIDHLPQPRIAFISTVVDCVSEEINEFDRASHYCGFCRESS